MFSGRAARLGNGPAATRSTATASLSFSLGFGNGPVRVGNHADAPLARLAGRVVDDLGDRRSRPARWPGWSASRRWGRPRRWSHPRTGPGRFRRRLPPVLRMVTVSVTGSPSTGEGGRKPRLMGRTARLGRLAGATVRVALARLSVSSVSTTKLLGSTTTRSSRSPGGQFLAAIGKGDDSRAAAGDDVYGLRLTHRAWVRRRSCPAVGRRHFRRGPRPGFAP